MKTSKDALSEDRIKLVQACIGLPVDFDELRRQIAKFGWDYDGQIKAVLSRADVATILQRYLKSEIGNKQIEDWADFLEGRDDIAFENGAEAILNEVIHVLANPELHGNMTIKSAQELLPELSRRATE